MFTFWIGWVECWWITQPAPGVCVPPYHQQYITVSSRVQRWKVKARGGDPLPKTCRKIILVVTVWEGGACPLLHFFDIWSYVIPKVFFDQSRFHSIEHSWKATGSYTPTELSFLTPPIDSWVIEGLQGWDTTFVFGFFTAAKNSCYIHRELRNKNHSVQDSWRTSWNPAIGNPLDFFEKSVRLETMALSGGLQQHLRNTDRQCDESERCGENPVPWTADRDDRVGWVVGLEMIPIIWFQKHT